MVEVQQVDILHRRICRKLYSSSHFRWNWNASESSTGTGAADVIEKMVGRRICAYSRSYISPMDVTGLRHNLHFQGKAVLESLATWTQLKHKVGSASTLCAWAVVKGLHSRRLQNKDKSERDQLQLRHVKWMPVVYTIGSASNNGDSRETARLQSKYSNMIAKMGYFGRLATAFYSE
ncbi:hypothetical protein BT96DRAFT_936095 [Gymnopus androsaceus JB14]|uniref:Uncharacterized protein n=1 Tax=Gymnopus androsaceus JB14 TaxID=1447944 RepID=A0A6A4I382_9AGAR|nr:hypothetical protein BT96DRAFT_936095 [Gymnopus androsaceus JB14]